MADHELNGGGGRREVVERYTDQPAVMPREVRRRIEEACEGQAVQLYSVVDLDASMRLAERWLAITHDYVALVGWDDGVRSIRRPAIKALRSQQGLSCTTLALLGEEGEAALAIIRYTHRQRRTAENIKYVLEQQIEGFDVETGNADKVYAEAVTRPVVEAQSAVTGSKFSAVWRLIGYLRPYKKRVIWGGLAAAGMTLMTLVPPYLTGMLIDDVVRPFQEGTAGLAEARRLAWLLVAGVAIVSLSLEFFAFVRLRTMSVLGELVARDLRDQLYEHLQKLSLGYFSSKQTGSIISRVSSDTDRLWDFIAFGVVEVSLSVLKLVGLALVLLWLDWQMGLLMILPVPVLLYAIFRHGQKMQRLFLRAWRKWSNLTDVLSDTIPGVRVVKAFHQEERETERFRGRNETVVSEFNAIHDIWTKFWPGLMLGIHSLVIVVWAIALPRMITDGTATLTIGEFVAFLLYLTMFFQPIEIIGQMARMLNRATSSAHRIFEVLDTEPQIVDVREPVRLEPVEGCVTFDNVSFSYDGVRQVLQGVSFDVRPGEMIGLVGPSGAGKTTITNLIARFYEATDGRILIDGVELGRLDTGNYRQQIGMVLQDSYLFHGSVLHNVRYGRPEASLGDVIEAAKAANAHDFICNLPHGYDTMVGERGHTLSGGERQRVAIARAILANPRILILDEATSSVDTETERKIQEALDRLVSGRTVFAIAHRLSTLKRASRLFVVEKGRLAEEGTHAELLALEDGTYRKLHQMQQELHEAHAV